MTLTDRRHSVWLGDRRVGVLLQRGDFTRFQFSPEYLADPERPLLGLIFEQDLSARHAAALRLPAWFSNLLPEGRLRDWIAADRGVSPQREMELLAQVGHDLPGAVRVGTDDTDSDAEIDWSAAPDRPETADPSTPAGLQFSLAGVALKFSMLATGDRLTLPAHGLGGDWIVKLPDRTYPDVPVNEHAMMTLAGRAGIEIPTVRLVHRDNLASLPEGVWPGHEPFAYAVQRFDRSDDRRPVHIEDLAQVRGFYPDQKYDGNYETVASLCFRGNDISGLREFGRRLAFSVLISNADAHLKNWSLIYRDGRRPALAPAYDLVSTLYPGLEHHLGLKFGGSRRYSAVRIATFAKLDRKLRAHADLADVVEEVISRTVEHWPKVAESLSASPRLRQEIDASIASHSRSLRGS